MILPVATGVVAVNLGTGISATGMKMDPGDWVEITKTAPYWAIEIQTVSCGRLFTCVDESQGDGCASERADEWDGKCGSAGARSGSLECGTPSPHERMWVDATTGAGIWDATWDKTFVDEVKTTVVGGALKVTQSTTLILQAPVRDLLLRLAG